MSKIFEIKFTKLFDKNYEEIFKYKQPVGLLKRINDVIDYIVEEKLETNNPVCKCMLSPKQRGTTIKGIKLKDYNMNTYLNETGGHLEIIQSRNFCVCGKYNLIKMESENQKLKKENEILRYQNRPEIIKMNVYSLSPFVWQ